jgi:hypothetical protein
MVGICTGLEWLIPHIEFDPGILCLHYCAPVLLYCLVSGIHHFMLIHGAQSEVEISFPIRLHFPALPYSFLEEEVGQYSCSLRKLNRNLKNFPKAQCFFKCTAALGEFGRRDNTGIGGGCSLLRGPSITVALLDSCHADLVAMLSWRYNEC